MILLFNIIKLFITIKKCFIKKVNSYGFTFENREDGPNAQGSPREMVSYALGVPGLFKRLSRSGQR